MERRGNISGGIEEGRRFLICRTYDPVPFLQFGEFVVRHVDEDSELYGRELLRITEEYGIGAVEGFVHADEEMIEVVDGPQTGDDHLVLYYAALFYGRGKIGKDEFLMVDALLHQNERGESGGIDGLRSACDIINPLKSEHVMETAAD